VRAEVLLCTPEDRPRAREELVALAGGGAELAAQAGAGGEVAARAGALLAALGA
jgi:hypothetical protein